MALKVYTAPEVVTRNPDVFIAGGISNCPDWQQRFIDGFSNTDYILANPRQPQGMLSDSVEAQEQIAWEFDALRRSRITAFWFPQETLCPITLFELGAALGEKRRVVIATHPGYGRRFDVIEQVKHYNALNGTQHVVYDSIEVLVVATKMFLEVLDEQN